MTKPSILLFVSLFLLSFIYGFLISLPPNLTSHFITLTYLIASSAFMLKIFYRGQQNSFSMGQPLIATFCIHLGILLGWSVAAGNESLLWAVDSYNIHLPGSMRFKDWLTDGKGMAFSSLHDRIYFTHINAAVFISIFGKTPLATGLSLLWPKLVTLYFIHKTGERLFNKEKAFLAALLYAFMPTALFYGITFYKESFVQLFVALIIYAFVEVMHKVRVVPLIVGFLGMVFLTNERFYLAPCYGLAIFLFILVKPNASWTLRLSLLFMLDVFYRIFLKINHDFHHKVLFASLKSYREYFLSYPDVSPINHWLPYPLAVIKLLFSPFITPNKINSYHHFAGLLTWGSFFYHAVVFFFLLSTYRLLKERSYRLPIFLQLVPFATFLLAFGYVAPYSGRLRDSFLPLVVLIAAYSMAPALQKLYDWKLKRLF
jgi:hypothetical protein